MEFWLHFLAVTGVAFSPWVYRFRSLVPPSATNSTLTTWKGAAAALLSLLSAYKSRYLSGVPFFAMVEIPQYATFTFNTTSAKLNRH